MYRISLGAKVGNVGPASEADPTVRRGGLPQEKIRERQGGHFAQYGELIEQQGISVKQRPGAGFLRPSPSHTRRMSTVPQHHAEGPGLVKPSSVKMPAEDLEYPATEGMLTPEEPLWSDPENSSMRRNHSIPGMLGLGMKKISGMDPDVSMLTPNDISIDMGSREQGLAFWRSEERRCEADLRRQKALAILRIRKAELRLALFRVHVLTAQYLAKSAQELDMGSVDMSDALKALDENELQPNWSRSCNHRFNHSATTRSLSLPSSRQTRQAGLQSVAAAHHNSAGSFSSLPNGLRHPTSQISPSRR